jgi:hydroxypyruvate isomerase
MTLFVPGAICKETLVNRRSFTRKFAQAALAATAVGRGQLFAGAGTGLRNGHNSLPDAPFRISVMLWTVFADLPFEKRLEGVAAAGYKYVELVGEYRRWSADDFTRVNAKRKELGIRFDASAGIQHGVCDPATREALLAELRDLLPIMERIECPTIILFSGSAVSGVSRVVQHQSCVEGLKAAADLVEGKTIAGEPVRLLLENLAAEQWPGYYLTSAAEGFEIVKAVNHPQVQLLYDLFHGQVAEGNLIEKLEHNIQHVGTVHIADVPGRHEPGTGEINYDMVFRKLAQLQYNHVVAMEFLPTGDPVARLRGAREMALLAGAA